jgi:hypothetical protein
MGTTGSSDKAALNSALPDIISRIKEYTTVPLAVGFGVSTREHYKVVVDAGAEGVVIGSKLVSVIKQAPPAEIAAKVEEYCRSISLKGHVEQDAGTEDVVDGSRLVSVIQQARAGIAAKVKGYRRSISLRRRPTQKHSRMKIPGQLTEPVTNLNRIEQDASDADGSKPVFDIKQAPPAEIAVKVEENSLSISLKGQPTQKHSPTKSTSQPTEPVTNPNRIEQPCPSSSSETPALPARFGQFGGQYVPEALFDCLVQLEEAHKSAMADPEFWKEWESLFGYMNRPSNLYFAEKLTNHAGGAKIWMKREDLSVLQ